MLKYHRKIGAVGFRAGARGKDADTRPAVKTCMITIRQLLSASDIVIHMLEIAYTHRRLEFIHLGIATRCHATFVIPYSEVPLVFQWFGKGFIGVAHCTALDG